MVNDIYLKDKNIFRVIYCDKDNWLVIDCRKRNMPKWVNSGFLNDYEIIDQDRLLNELNIKFLSEENMKEHYFSVALVWEFILLLANVHTFTPVLLNLFLQL